MSKRHPLRTMAAALCEIAGRTRDRELKAEMLRLAERYRRLAAYDDQCELPPRVRRASRLSVYAGPGRTEAKRRRLFAGARTLFSGSTLARASACVRDLIASLDSPILQTLVLPFRHRPDHRSDRAGHLAC